MREPRCSENCSHNRGFHASGGTTGLVVRKGRLQIIIDGTTDTSCTCTAKQRLAKTEPSGGVEGWGEGRRRCEGATTRPAKLPFSQVRLLGP